MNNELSNAINKCGLPAGVTTAIIERYQAPDRHYHNVAHIERMFQMASTFGIELSQAQILGILFHDAVYDSAAPKGDNERASAQLLRNWCEGHIDSSVIDEAAGIVLCTIDHKGWTEAQKEVVDLDLGGLALSQQTVEQDGYNVFLEYQEFLAWDTYVVGRAKFFASLLERPHILTGQAMKGLEAKLRSNLHAVISASQP